MADPESPSPSSPTDTSAVIDAEHGIEPETLSGGGRGPALASAVPLSEAGSESWPDSARSCCPLVGRKAEHPSGQRNGPVMRTVPPGDCRERLVCPDCGFIDYENPRIVVGAVVVSRDNKVLMCRRAIPPRKGFWTLPAGYLETGETTEQGAIREAWEEACARIEIDTLLAVYNIPRISQVQLIYRARLAYPEIGPGEESLEVRLFDWDRLPWEAIAFPTVRWALNHYREVEGQEHFSSRTNPPGQGDAY